jgi:hypothetical protein
MLWKWFIINEGIRENIRNINKVTIIDIKW